MPVEAWRGNHATIKQFLDEAPNRLMAEKLLSVISSKDLRDVEPEVLKDNQVNVTDTSEIYLRYVLNPRVENEWLTPYKAVLKQALAHIRNPQQLVQWCCDNITVEHPWHSDDGVKHGRNPQQLRQLPLSVFSTRKTDELGRKIFFVAAARSLGFPARINEVDGRLQYYLSGVWNDVTFEQKGSDTETHTGKLMLEYGHKSAYLDNPQYYTHFTLSRIADGQAQLLTYPEDATWQQDFARGIELETGEYMLTSGTRMASGKVLANVRRFTMGEGIKHLPLIMPEDNQDVQVIGSLNAENFYHDLSQDVDKSLLSTTGRGYYILAIVQPNHEPTNHTLRDIAACKSEFEAWGRKMVILLGSDNEAKRFNFAEFANLPSTVVWGIDKQGAIMREIVENFKLRDDSRPLYLVCDSFNRVLYIQQGYTIHMGEQLLKVIKKL